MATKCDSQTGKDSPGQPATRAATFLSTLFWIAGFLLLFIIPVSSPLIWLSDLLLLIGFFPILLAWRPAWTWLLFGVCNLFIGAVLELAKFLPDQSFPVELRLVRAHMADYHCPVVWLFVGLIAIIYGSVRLIKNCCRHLRKHRRCSPSNRPDCS